MTHEATVHAVAAVLRAEFDALTSDKCEGIARKALQFAREDGDASRDAVECIARELAYDAELALEDDGIGASDLEDISAGEWQSDLEDAWRS